MKEEVKSDKVGDDNHNLTRGDQILHEKKYNTRHGISAIPDEICGEIWCQQGQQEVQ